jgi:hypothetical protein
MNDRDRFALAALPYALQIAAIVTRSEDDPDDGGTVKLNTHIEFVASDAARYAYQMADAMLREREK